LARRASKVHRDRLARKVNKVRKDRLGLLAQLAAQARRVRPDRRGRLDLKLFGTSLALIAAVLLTPLVTLLPTVDQRGIELMLMEATSVTLQSKDHSGRRLLRRVCKALQARRATLGRRALSVRKALLARKAR
jgi:hypothetical protein